MTDLDFIPSSYHATASHRRRTKSQIVWGGGMIAAMVLWLWSQHVSLCAAQDQLDQSRAQWGQLDSSRSYFDALAAEREQLSRKDQILSGLDDSASMVVVLAELSGF